MKTTMIYWPRLLKCNEVSITNGCAFYARLYLNFIMNFNDVITESV